MRYTKSTAIALALCVAAGSTAALASETESTATCLAASRQVAAALRAAQNQNADTARKEKMRGLEFCNAGYYHQGMVHYAKAMELLGGEKLARP